MADIEGHKHTGHLCYWCGHHEYQEANSMSDPTKDLAKAAEPFQRVLRVMASLDIADDTPLRKVIPGAWPTWGEFKRLMEALSK